MSPLHPQMQNKLFAIATFLAVIIRSADSFSRGSLSIGNGIGNRRLETGLRAEQRAPTKDPISIAIKDEGKDDDADDLVDSLTEKLGEMEGLWYSDDFYGPHGREWVRVSATLVGESATRALVAVKVTGDPNVPAGCVTFKTASWPGVGCMVPAEIHVRADPADPDGFSWLRGELTLVAKDEIRLMCQYNFLMSSEGTFYQKNDEDQGGGDN